jgi:hypothetical protein
MEDNNIDGIENDDLNTYGNNIDGLQSNFNDYEYGASQDEDGDNIKYLKEHIVITLIYTGHAYLASGHLTCHFFQATIEQLF